jgi:hypothetical protein
MAQHSVRNLKRRPKPIPAQRLPERNRDGLHVLLQSRGVDIAGEPHIGERVDQARPERSAPLQPVQLFSGKAGPFEEIERMLRSRRHQEAPPLGQCALAAAARPWSR